MSRTDAVAERLPGSPAAVLSLFDDSRGCEKFAQRVLMFDGGERCERVEPDDDEVLYVLGGAGAIEVGASRIDAVPGVGVFVSRGTRWTVESEGGLELASVLVRDPEPSPAGAHAVDLGAAGRADATAERQFTLGVWSATGCRSVTQFIGYVPRGRAPDHFHRYDEVIYILEGEGVLHVGDEHEPFGPGSCIHLPRTLVHSLENTGESELQLLGVFRPSGSPAEAYYPDGTPAVYSEE